MRAFLALDRHLKEPEFAEILRFLFDSNEQHGYGDRFARAVAQKLGWPLDEKPLEVTATAEWRTERGRRIDVLVVVRSSWRGMPKLVIAIETKLGSKEGPQQVSDYQNDITSRFPNTKAKLLFITIDGRTPDSASPLYRRTCPATALSWSDISDLAVPLAGIGKDFGLYLKHRFYANPKSPSNAINLIKHKVLPRARTLLRLRENQLQLKWHYPKSAPKEFNWILA